MDNILYDGKRKFTISAVYPGAKPLPFASLELTNKYKVEQKSLTEFKSDGLTMIVKKMAAELQMRANAQRFFFAPEKVCGNFWKLIAKR